MQVRIHRVSRAKREGRGASRRLRHAGKAPGIVYGGADKPAPIELDHNALYPRAARTRRSIRRS